MAKVTTINQNSAPSPFGMVMPGRNWKAGSANGYGFGFNGQLKNDEITTNASIIDFGARICNVKLGRWFSIDRLNDLYPSQSHYSFAVNNPISVVDLGGNLVIFVNGLMLDQWKGQDNREEIPSVPGVGAGGTMPNPNYAPYPTNEVSTGDFPQYLGKDFTYWGEVDKEFMTRFNDPNNIYVSGSNQASSEAKTRYEAGIKSGMEIVQMIMCGQITLADDETIKIVGHSQGGAHAAGIAYALNWAYEEGMINNPIEQISYLAPHQPTEFETPEGIYATQYSRKSDKISSTGVIPGTGISGHSWFGKIKNLLAEQFIQLKDMEDERGGHNVGTFKEIFKIKKGEAGYVNPKIELK